ncbi:protein O-linked-mannose beta-1,2-N-acetylglucosaminyltransferase 1-like [Clavelina lepadiformis]|uniref:protein O-linked-mannose beta-1,2-N-acetylglucosaminyltransferase 1-like n=1 Tax=Clavelina lepadiformis TaxID=159417 RepID=UPI0040428DD3
MTETKPYSSPAWSSPQYSRHTWQHVHYLHDMKKTVRCFFWKNALRQRQSVRLLKCFMIFALITTCVFNVKLAIDARERYEMHKDLFLNDLNEKTFVLSYDDEYENDYHQTKKKSFELEVLSSKNLMKIKVDEKTVIQRDDRENDRGIHVIAINQVTGAVMAVQVFDTYLEGQDKLLRSFVNSINDNNRILVMAVKDEASLHLGKDTRQFIKEMGSSQIENLKWRSMWAIITNKNGNVKMEELKTSEDLKEWASPVQLKVTIESVSATEGFETCNWPTNEENSRRKHFCSKYDGYGALCRCIHPDELDLAVNSLPDNLVHNIPVAVIASNRPHYLYRMLRSLLLARGANPAMVTVFIDGFYEETMEVAKLMNVKGIYHTPSGVKNARISQHYRSSLSAVLTLNPDAKYAIILEEDLDVSPDFFSYFSQTIHLMDQDSSIYCISAWNDQGYEHSTHDSSLLYRVETFPGLGWMLRRSLFEEELEEQWPPPEKQWDWDMWMRQPLIRKERECIIPDVSRTFHFGLSGINMNSYFHKLYFSQHRLNTEASVQLKDVDLMTKDNYEKLMHKLIRRLATADHTKSPCDDDFINNDNEPNSDGFVVYIKMDNSEHLESFIQLSKCLKIWDLDVRDLHKNSFRTFIKRKHVVFIGYPASPYSIYKPVDLEPIALD